MTNESYAGGYWGKIETRVLLVRYTHRPTGLVRLIGAGYWRQGKKLYENYWKKDR